MTKRLMAGIIAVAALVAWSPALSAHPGHEQKVMGTVSMMAADHVMVKTTDGKEITVHFTKDTKFLRAKKAMKASDIKMGMRVVIAATTDEKDARIVAKTIELGPAAATR